MVIVINIWPIYGGYSTTKCCKIIKVGHWTFVWKKLSMSDKIQPAVLQSHFNIVLVFPSLVIYPLDTAQLNKNASNNIVVITLMLLRPRIGLWRFSIFETPDGAEPYSHSSNISRKDEWGAITVRGASEGDASLPLILILWKPKTNSSDLTMAGRQFFSFLKLKKKHNFYQNRNFTLCVKRAQFLVQNVTVNIITLC